MTSPSSAAAAVAADDSPRSPSFLPRPHHTLPASFPPLPSSPPAGLPDKQPLPSKHLLTNSTPPVTNPSLPPSLPPSLLLLLPQATPEANTPPHTPRQGGHVPPPPPLPPSLPRPPSLPPPSSPPQPSPAGDSFAPRARTRERAGGRTRWRRRRRRRRGYERDFHQ